jgi:hypothetical protein
VEDHAVEVRCPQCERRELDVPANAASVTEEGNVLSYGRAAESQVRAGPFMLGFFGTLGYTVVAFVGLFLLGVASPGSDSGSVALRIVGLLFVIAIYTVIGWKARQLSKLPAWSGIGRGVIVGMCLSMIAMIPCAGVIIGGINI